LATGQLEAAVKVAGCFRQMIEMQPEPTERFYTTIQQDGALGTVFPSEEAFWRVIKTTVEDRYWGAIGLPFSFAILLYEATAEEQYLDLAKWFFDFQVRGINPWDVGPSGKASWGCSMMYRITGDRRYRDAALHIAQNFVNWQSSSGWFEVNLDREKEADQGRGFTTLNFDHTAEFVLWLSLIGSNLLARDAE
jgi:hypothetical protein